MYEPIDVQAWIERARRAGERQGACNEEFWREDGDFMVMLFAGPIVSRRRDFHINSSPEFFYQLAGSLRCRVIEGERFVDVHVGPGSMVLVPAGVPHLNLRDEDSVGLVIHKRRSPGTTDAIAWFCESCCALLHRVDYEARDLRAQLEELTRAFMADEQLRTCRRCGAVMASDPA